MSGDAAPGTQFEGMADIPAGAAYRVSLPEFEGPLDLLLHLCKTHEIQVVNIPISFITTKYLEYLEMMQSMSVEVAAEYLVMAATLCYLKSRELVPTPEPLEVAAEEGEEAIDPREELIRRLLEYQKYKDAAEALGTRPIEGKNVFGRGAPMEAVAQAGLAEHSVWKLIESFGTLLEKAAPKPQHNVIVDRVSVSSRINQIVDLLEAGGGTFRFDAIIDLELPEAELRDLVVVTLLAVLELAKLRVIRVLQDPTSGAFFISQREGAALDEARRVTATSDDSTTAVEPPAPAADVVETLQASAVEEIQAAQEDAEDDAAMGVEETLAAEDAVLASVLPPAYDTATPEEPDGKA